ncbi:hypothetical protein CV_1717 [Chromobacterium violaceum ATCC 12472]|uniref:Uncharacterized protein n=1 Tax=Chromobacterium violaceum (strain ATCC 12472 / DSM 30191 / JCM 1249 / CCUG 213 / NBRC 12614 / NCIMB 9131 / NCTC 9757 / MK) TaxID=243365 RepID=Q7NXB0_CHRVO|nr:hypothetical protein CV_1717 [Chromobacterium violaceum ATCC 12472]
MRQVWAQGGQLFPEEASDEVWVRATAVMHRSASPFAGMAERLAQLKGDLRGGLARQSLGGCICDDKAAVAAVWRQASGQAGCQAGAAHLPLDAMRRIRHPPAAFSNRHALDFLGDFQQPAAFPAGEAVLADQLHMDAQLFRQPFLHLEHVEIGCVGGWGYQQDQLRVVGADARNVAQVMGMEGLERVIDLALVLADEL